jgi:hypothetical protein
MNKESLPKWFMVLAVLGLIWNLMGVAAYISQVTMDAEAMAALPERDRVFFENLPAYYTGAFALAVFGGSIGCLLLILKKKLATPILLISLLAVLVQMYYSFFVSGMAGQYGPGEYIMPVMIVILAVYLFMLSLRATKAGWIT